jgi:hypothetical protein
LALATIFSGWSANARATHGAIGDIAVLCSVHDATPGGPGSRDDGNHQRLCALLCSLQASGGGDAAMAPATIALPSRWVDARRTLAGADHGGPQSIFLQDHPARGPPSLGAA